MIKICIYLCVWRRLEKLPKSLCQLDSQTFKDFDLVIINNNPSESLLVDSLVKEYKGSLSVIVRHQEVNLGPMARYIEAKKDGYDYSVFLDDDEEFHPTMMETFNAEKEPKSLKASFGFNFSNDISKRQRASGGTAKVLGPGGMIADTSLFHEDGFWNEWRPEFYVADDLWLSYYARKSGWKLEVIPVKVFNNQIGNMEISMVQQETIKMIKQQLINKYQWFENNF